MIWIVYLLASQKKKKKKKYHSTSPHIFKRNIKDLFFFPNKKKLHMCKKWTTKNKKEREKELKERKNERSQQTKTHQMLHFKEVQLVLEAITNWRHLLLKHQLTHNRCRWPSISKQQHRAKLSHHHNTTQHNTTQHNTTEIDSFQFKYVQNKQYSMKFLTFDIYIHF